MSYRYEFVILSESDHRFISSDVESDSLVDAFCTMLKENPKLVPSVLTIYCRRPKSGDLQLMGTYDGNGTIIVDGIQKSRILRLSNGNTYELVDERFRRFFL